MSQAEDIRKALRRFLKSSGDKYGKVCTVVNVSCDPIDGMMVCDCKPLDGTAVLVDVRLTADFQPTSTKVGMILVPKENSFVIVQFINNTSAYVSMVSEVDFIFLNGNEYGGLVKVQQLVDKINRLENAFNLHTHAGVTVGMGVTAITATPISPITLRVDLENTKVVHGASNLI